jgi:predicted ATPase
MSLNALNLSNFKRFKNQTIDLSSPITLLLGPNSSGKSSILKAILGLKQTIVVSSNEHEVFATQGEYVDLGTYKDYVHRHNVGLPVTIGLVMNSSKKDTRIVGQRVSIAITYDFDNNTEQARILRILIKDEETKKSITLERKKTRTSYRLFANRQMAETIAQLFSRADDPQFIKHLENGLSVTHRERLKFSLKPEDGRGEAAWLYRIFEILIDSFSEKLEKDIFYLGPLRSSPSRSYLRTSHSVAVGCKGEHTPSVLATLIKRQKKVTRGQSDLTVSYAAMEEWLDTIFPGRKASTLTVEELVKLKISKTGSDVAADAITDVGFGFSQVFPILVQAAVMPSGSTLIIEQPELHLHPMAQANLAKVISSAARMGRRFIIETHSEHFVRGLQLAVSEYKLSKGNAKGVSPDSIRVLYVPESPRDIQEMPLNEWGEFTSDWPTGFFDEAYKLAFALLKNKAKNSTTPSTKPNNNQTRD